MRVWSSRIWGGVLVCLQAAAAQANDSMGHISAGGVALARSAGIEMRSEDLFISAKEVRVRYRFFNTTGADIETLVAFPMPELPAPSEVQLISIPHEDQDNFLAFETRVDGVAKDVQIDQRAISLGIDRTDMLRALGIPLQPHARRSEAALQALPKDKLNELLALGLIQTEDMDSMAGNAPVFFPNWSMRATYYWSQVFPAQKEIVVEHRYEPSVGASSGTMVGLKGSEPGMLDDYKKRYCVDDNFIKAAANAHAAANAKGTPLGERRIGYILSTGANWMGPIKSFKLTVDKGQPDALVSFCGDGVKKVSATSFEMSKTDFWPHGDLEILLLAPLR